MLNQRLAVCGALCSESCCVEKRDPYNQSSEIIEINCQNQGLEMFPNLTEYEGLLIQLLDLRNNSFSKFTVTLDVFDGASFYELNLDDNQFLDIEYNAFSRMKELKKLSLNGCGLVSVDLDFLRNIPGLSVLSLRSNNIKELKDQSVFVGSPLKELDLSHNPGLRIHVKVLAPTLTYLAMDYSDIELSDLKFLYNLSEMKTLSIDGAYSKQYSIQNGAFKELHLSALESLSLSNSSLKAIFREAFEGLDNLKYLDLSRNDLNNVIFEVTGRIPDLQVLKLSYNADIQTIMKLTNRNLNELHMEGTGVNLILYDAFTLIGDSLVELNLRSCQLPPEGMFLVDAFRPLRSLRKLDLSFNYLREIFNETFDDLNELEELDLSGNILTFSRTDFSGLEESLKILKLQNMSLQVLPLALLSTLENLQELDASFNNFTNITNRFFEGISVGTLNLTNCNISEIHQDSFKQFNKTNVILDGNNITDIEFLSVLSRNTFRTLTMRGNNINCSVLNNEVHLAVFEKLEGYCSIGNQSEQLGKYFSEKLNMNWTNTAGKRSWNQVAFLIISIVTIALSKL
jgi:Leucine-rich repeat (LRR) protein